MKIKLLLSLVLVCSVLAQAQIRSRKPAVSNPPFNPSKISNSSDNASQLPIRRVILYSNGVAYVERRGLVSGNAEINLSFKQSQVDDVLKSMLVLDLGQGRIGAVSYNSSLPASARTAEIPFSVDAQTANGGGIAGVLGQLQGAKVGISTAQGNFIGSILTIEKRSVAGKPGEPPVSTSFLVIASDAGEISSFDLSEVKSVKLLDEGTKRDVSEFANATASTRRRDAKTITVTSAGAGQREMVVSYTIAAPIWKTTYRVVLDEQGKPFFQGWAIVDNVSEEDWSDVQLSLISGTPISFIQPIQKPLYRYRPVVPIPQDLNLQPQVYDEESHPVSRKDSREEVNVSNESVADTVTQRQISGLPINGRQAQNFMIQGQMASSNSFTVDGASNQTAISDALISGNSGVQANARGEEIGDLFEYRIEQPVTVLRDRSALIPIVQTKMDGERVAIYNEAAQASRVSRPMSGMLLKNLTPLTFESGSLTVIDRDAYAGEALMERLKPKEQRLISFALDLGTLVTIDNDEDREPARLVKVVNGVFEVHYFQTDKKIYKIANQTDRKKVVYIEHPIRQNWTLSETSAKPDYTTARYYRFRVELEPFEKKELTVGENQGLMDTYALSTLSPDQLNLFITRRYINEETRAKLAKLISLRNQIAQIDAKYQAYDDEEEKISTDQKRIRDNIEALSKTPEAKTLIARYIAKADEQESRLEQIQKDRQSLETQKTQIESQLAQEIKNFEIK